MKKYLSIILTAFSAALLIQAADLTAQAGTTTVEQKFKQASQAYSEGRYAEAAQGYADVLKLRGPSAGLYYDLGCADLKASLLGPAVVNFHRAARLAPRDPDIRANLKFVEALTRPENEDPASQQGFLISILERWVFLLSDREISLLQVVFLLCLTLGATVMAAGYRGILRRAVLGFTIAALCLFLLNSTVLGIHYYRAHYMKEAVVVIQNAEAWSGPGEDNTRVLVLPEGTVVRMRDVRNDWVLISLPSGRSGWLLSKNLEVI
jgi:tetratricopeptide (TPR) repeat protein